MAINVKIAKEALLSMDNLLVNFVVMRVISLIVLVMLMNKIRNEMLYQLSMKHADKLFERGIINKQQHKQFQSEMLRKYQPFISVMT